MPRRQHGLSRQARSSGSPKLVTAWSR
jgi:hypothetical protein